MRKRDVDSVKTKPLATSPGRYAYEELDRVLHERARLGILTSLVAQPKGLSFNDLKQLCSLTDGNLNRHLAVLSDANLITIQKQQGEGRGQTTVRLTATGKKRFLDYVSALEAVVADAVAAQRQSIVIPRASRRLSSA
jgi:DNA-binding transcriptional ArsR family regulator